LPPELPEFVTGIRRRNSQPLIVDDKSMNYFYVYLGLFIFHLGIIRGFSSVLGRYRVGGFLPRQYIWSSKYHSAGVVFVIAAGFCLILIDNISLVVALSLCAIFMAVDMALIYKAVKMT
jgi:hypothetical protein